MGRAQHRQEGVRVDGAVHRYGPEDVSAFLCLCGGPEENAAAEQLLASISLGRGAVLLCRTSTEGLNLEHLDVASCRDGLAVAPVSPAHFANIVMRRAEAASVGMGHSDRMHRANMRMAELAATVRGVRLASEATAAGLGVM